jgi:hypothetical protein
VTRVIVLGGEAPERAGRAESGFDATLFQCQGDLLPSLRAERDAVDHRRLIWDVNDAIWLDTSPVRAAETPWLGVRMTETRSLLRSAYSAVESLEPPSTNDHLDLLQRSARLLTRHASTLGQSKIDVLSR